MALLFGNAAGRNQSKNLVEFRAGKMQMKGNIVHAEKRKGLVYVWQSDDSLMHFCWKDRVTGTVEDDLIIFPDDVEFKRVQQCTTGRVYLLKFKSSNRKLFFWMQDPKTEKDDDNCAKVNEYLNNPPAPGSRSGGSTPNPLGADIPGDADLQNLLSTMSQQQFMQLLGGMSGVGGGGMASLSNYLNVHGLGSQFGSGSSTQATRRSGQSSTTAAASTTAASTASTASTTTVTTAVTTNTTTSSSAAAVTTATAPSNSSPSATAVPSADATLAPQVQLSDLRSILSGISVEPEDESNGAAARPPDVGHARTAGSSGANMPAVDLSTAMTTEALQPILSNPEFVQRLQNLLPQTAEISGSSNAAPIAELQSTVQSAQFRQAVSLFSAALQSGQLGPLLEQFGFGEDVVNASVQGDMDTFISVLEASQKDNEKKEDKKDKDEDDEMALD